MKIIQALFFLFATLPWTVAIGQVEDSKLKFWSDCLTNLDSDDFRQNASREFQKSLLQELRKNDFHHDYSEVKWMNVYEAPDSSFRFFNWELRENDDKYSYFGIVLSSDGNITELNDESLSLGKVERETLAAEEWYGAYYYNIVPFQRENETLYLMLGLNHFNRAYDKKIAEVMRFSNGEVSFGAPVFVKEQEGVRDNIKKRLILQFSDPAYVRLNYDTSNHVLAHNHILLVPEASFEGEPMLAQDGTYEIYRQQEDGIWKYEEFMFEQNLKRAGEDDQETVKEPKTKVKRDLLGREKGKK